MWFKVVLFLTCVTLFTPALSVTIQDNARPRFFVAVSSEDSTYIETLLSYWLVLRTEGNYTPDGKLVKVRNQLFHHYLPPVLSRDQTYESLSALLADTAKRLWPERKAVLCRMVKHLRTRDDYALVLKYRRIPPGENNWSRRYIMRQYNDSSLPYVRIDNESDLFRNEFDRILAALGLECDNE